MTRHTHTHTKVKVAHTTVGPYRRVWWLLPSHVVKRVFSQSREMRMPGKIDVIYRSEGVVRRRRRRVREEGKEKKTKKKQQQQKNLRTRRETERERLVCV